MFFHKIFKREEDKKIVPREDLLNQALELGEEYEAWIKKCQDEYLSEFDKEILKAARNGEKRVISFRYDEYSEPWQTKELLNRVKEKYKTKGFDVEEVRPYSDHIDTWLRITWNNK
jgi:hypothetical protein